jgi:hypothetical protein
LFAKLPNGIGMRIFQLKFFSSTVCAVSSKETLANRQPKPDKMSKDFRRPQGITA